MIRSYIKKIIWALTWRRKLCKNCDGLFAVGNFGPCYSCRQGSNFEYAEMIPEPKREPAGEYVYVFKGWEMPKENDNIQWGRHMVVYDREFDEEGRLISFKAKPADE